MDTNGEKATLDTDLSTPQSDSFWEIGKYSRVVKRCEDGNRLTTDLISMINERAELEKTFSKMLRSWSKKWSEYVGKSPEFGTMSSAWRALMTEADASAEVHQAVHDELEENVIVSIKSWQKNKYVKSMMHVKCTKEFDEDFKRAQKPWAKLYMKVEKYKREYHTATKNLKLAESQENNAKLDGSIPLEQKSKLTEKVERCRKEKEVARGKYAEMLQDLNRANPKYMDDMKEVFDRCQIFERDRLSKFREFLGNTETALDMNGRFKAPVFQQVSQTIKSADPERDLTWWSDTFGATMKMNWPIFEEYSETHRTLNRRGRADIERENPVVVTAIRSSNTNGSNGENRGLNNSHLSGLNNNNGSFSSVPPYSLPGSQTYQNQVSYPAAVNPFGDDEDNVDSLSSPTQSSHQSPPSTSYLSNENSAGVPVRALYDYEAQEPDELSFKQGEVFTKLEDEDDQGWCKGKVGTRVGLYPATYVEAI